MPSTNALLTLLRILLPVATVAVFALAGVFFWVQFIFSRRPKSTAKTGAILREATHKKNVTVRSRRGSMLIKDLTKALYIYTVDGVEYGIRGEFHATKRQTPRFVPVVYVKRFPRFAYMDDIGSFSDIRYGLWGGILVAWGLSLAVITVTLLT
ncbi:MAG: hypothetical protein J6K29_06415 [Clostridia bacterium]|nr:hypothetical protein [Clostridia bacterium]